MNRCRNGYDGVYRGFNMSSNKPVDNRYNIIISYNLHTYTAGIQWLYVQEMLVKSQQQ